MSRSGLSVPSALGQGVAAAAAAGLGFVLLKLLPSLELGLFAAGSARLASLFTGQPVFRVENGWMLPDADLSIVVTAGCSATDFFLMVATLLAWRLMEKSPAHSSAAPQLVSGRQRRSRLRKKDITLGVADPGRGSEQPPESLAGTSSATPEAEEKAQEQSKRKIDTRIVERLADWPISPANLLGIGGAALGGLAAALPLSIFLNSLRVVVVAQAHRCLIDHFSASYGPILHLAVGVAIFLPSLIALNGLFHLLASRRSSVPASV